MKEETETLEEVAKRLLPDRNGFTNRDRLNFIEGANYKEIMIYALKIQQERMYNEKEVKNMFKLALIKFGIMENEFLVSEIFEQFKKK